LLPSSPATTNLKDATAARKSENENNLAEIAEAGKAIEAVKFAVEHLAEFHGLTKDLKAGTDKGGYDSVVSMLTIVESDFSQQKTLTEKNEKEADSDFKTLGGEINANIAVMQTNIDHFEQEITSDTTARLEKQSEIENIKNQLAAEEKIKSGHEQTCNNTMSFEERNAKREAEIQSLKEALEIIESSN